MNIILGEHQIQHLAAKYTILPLDKFSIDGHDEPVQSFCLIEQMPLSDLSQLESWIDLHHKLMDNYRKKNWNFCTQAIQHLIGHWNGELDTFYQDLSTRIAACQELDPGPDWTGIIKK